MISLKKNTIKYFCILASAALALHASAVDTDAVMGSSKRDTANIEITIDTSRDRKRISKYIYGINSDNGISGVTASAVKQSGAELSSYNWETNSANMTSAGDFRNSYDLIESAERSRWNEPALLTDILVSGAKKADIPSRYVTLQMMGMAANDAGGTVTPDSPRRWAEVRFGKGGDLSIQPDIHDDRVYMDEYVSYLVNAYGYAADGGINGYFLDSEPEKWADKYSVLNLEKLTAKSLLSKSVSLAEAVKKIDPTALIYGPSIGGLESFVNLENPDDWEQYKDSYSWFIDYYLDTMRAASEQTGVRLLDVLDLHYISEAQSVILEPIIGTNTVFANEQRMQSVRVLWDSNYTENSPAAILHKQHTPVIPTVQASIRMYYPGTKLSFSEYNFGGGNHVSGGIAEADALGIFGEQDVYMACLKPDMKNYEYQKSGINIYTNYDGNGSSYGNISVYADNGGDIMSSAYASVIDGDENSLKAIFINKNRTDEKIASVSISSGTSFHTARVYRFDESSPEIVLADTVEDIENNSFEYIMNPLSVYLFEFDGNGIIDDEPDTDETSRASETSASTASSAEVHEHVDSSYIPNAGDVTTVPSETETVTSVSVVGTDASGDTITEIITETVTNPPASETSASSETGTEDDARTAVPPFLKILGTALVAAVAVFMLVILLTDNKGHGRKGH